MAVRTLESTLLADGFIYGEGARWRDGKFWFTEMHADVVHTIDQDGVVGVGAKAPHPSCIVWTPEGDLLTTSLHDGVLRRITPDGPEVYCDLGAIGPMLNDMVATPDGRVYVDVYTDLSTGGAPPGDIVLVTPDGAFRSVATGLTTPNGLAVTPDGSTLVASETFGNRVNAWTIEADGGLTDHRVFADLGERTPDGLCLDAEGAVWVGCTNTAEFIRVREGGEITDRVATGESWAVAPALGGPDMRTLYMVIDHTDFMGLAKGDSACRIETARVEVPGVGSP
jgi:sugar lactone lactonase YvrE